jgi:hypothetical protein
MWLVTAFSAGGVRSAHGQAPSSIATGWSLWLNNAVNILKLAEVSVLLAGVYQLWARRDERRRADEEAARMARKAANYQAWQVINSAQGKGGSGGRIDALADLSGNGVSLAGVRLDGAWLEDVKLTRAELRFASLRGTNLQGADLKEANLESADLTDAILLGADLQGAHLKGTILANAQLATADLRGADLTDVAEWQSIRSASYLNIEGVRNAPAGFRDWMIAHGAVDATVQEPIPTDPTYSTVWRAI